MKEGRQATTPNSKGPKPIRDPTANQNLRETAKCTIPTIQYFPKI